MSKHLLTNVITNLVNEYSNANEYGVSLITIPLALNVVEC